MSKGLCLSDVRQWTEIRFEHHIVVSPIRRTPAPLMISGFHFVMYREAQSGRANEP